jgi:hypothetical protein
MRFILWLKAVMLSVKLGILRCYRVSFRREFKLELSSANIEFRECVHNVVILVYSVTFV